VPNEIECPRLLIDESDVDLDNIWIHAQDDPFPGGHHYSLWLPSRIGNEWMKKLALNPTQRYEGMEHLSRNGLFWLAGELSAWRMEYSQTSVAPWLFVINTISQIAPSEQGIEIRGICSPFVRGSEAK